MGVLYFPSMILYNGSYIKLGLGRGGRGWAFITLHQLVAWWFAKPPSFTKDGNNQTGLRPNH